jgi:hypothetical protein
VGSKDAIKAKKKKSKSRTTAERIAGKNFFGF